MSELNGIETGIKDPVEPSSATSLPETPLEKKGWNWRHPFRRDNQETKPPVLPDAVSEPAVVAPEVPQDPEALRESLREDIARVIDLQVEAHFREKDIRRYGPNDAQFRAEGASFDEFIKNEKTTVEQLKGQSKELSTGLIGRLDEARGVLGNFCKVVERDGKKAVVLLAPLSREVRHIVSSRDNPKKTAYAQIDSVADTFYINEGGVYKVSIADPEAHKVEAVPGSIYNGYNSHYLDEFANNEKQVLDIYSREWHDGTYLAFDTVENIPKHVHLSPNEEHRYPKKRAEEEKKARDLREGVLFKLTWSHDNHTKEGLGQYSYGVSEDLKSVENIQGGGRVRVTTSLDATAAFDASVEGAKVYKDGVHLIPPVPNPVSAEPNPTQG